MGNLIKKFIIKNLITIHSGAGADKVVSTFKLAAVPAVGLSISERFTGWYFESKLFIVLLTVALFFDLGVGIAKHLKQHTFSFKKMLTGFMSKLGIVIVGYFLTEAFIQILADADLDSIYFKVATKIMLFIYPAGNTFVNLGILSNGKFPSEGFMKRFDKFNKTFDVIVFKQKEDETKNTDNNSAQ